jgi:hypothetical protein
MPPASFCNRGFPEHASGPSDLRQIERQAALRRMATSLSVCHQPSFLRLGVTWHWSPRRPPPRRPLAAVDLPRPDRLGHLLSRNRAALRVEDDVARRPCGRGPLSNDPARSAGLASGVPSRAALRGLSRKGTRTAAPKVPSALEASPRGSSFARPTTEAASQATDAFCSATHARPDRDERDAGSAVQDLRGSRIRSRCDRSALQDVCDRGNPKASPDAGPIARSAVRLCAAPCAWRELQIWLN